MILDQLLQRRAPSSGRKRTSKFGSPRRGGGRGRVRLRLLPVILVLVAVALSAGAYTGWRHVWPRLQARPEYQAMLSDLWVTSPPSWVKHDLVMEVQQQSDLPEQFSLLEGDPTTRLAAAFSRHPWVERVEQVRIRGRGRIEVHLRYRRPVAMVQTPGNLLPVDAHGTLLPAEDFSREETEHYPLIRGVQSSPLCPVGATWDDPLVVGGARIAEVLAPHWITLDLKALEAVFWSLADSGSDLAGQDDASAIDPSPADSGTFYLLSRGGTRVVWGRPPDTDHPGEIPAKAKISRLHDYVKENGSLEAPNGPYELDIRHWRDLSRRPRVVTSAELR